MMKVETEIKQFGEGVSVQSTEEGSGEKGDYSKWSGGLGQSRR